MECSCEVYKNGSNGVFELETVLAQISYGFEALLMPENVWVNSGNQIWDEGVQNWDFGMKNVKFVTANCQCSPRRASLRARRATWSQRAMFARHGEQSYSPRRVMGHRGHGLPTTASKATRYGEHGGDRRPVLPAMASKPLGRRVASVLVFLFCTLSSFHLFLLELTLGMIMKVSKGFICFPIALD